MAKNWRRVSVEEARTNSLYGVRGWLLVLVAGMMVIGPLLGVGKINSEIMSAEHQYPALLDLHDWKSYKEAMWLSFIALTFASFYGGMGLVRGEEWSVVRQAKVMLWISGPFGAIVQGIVVPLCTFSNRSWFDSHFIGQFIGVFVATLISAAIWTAYLSVSKRVRITYEQSLPVDSEIGSDSVSSTLQFLHPHNTSPPEEPVSEGRDKQSQSSNSKESS